jgi:hypothetical protein
MLYRAIVPTSIRTLPDNVKMRNLTAAYTRPGPPHTPMSRKTGTSISSQNTKKRNRFEAAKSPIMAVSATSSAL